MYSLMGEFLGWECGPDMTCHGTKLSQVVILALQMIRHCLWLWWRKKYQGLSFFGHVRAFKYKWNGSIVRGLLLWMFDRRGRAAILSCGWSSLLWHFELFSFYRMSSMMVDGMHKFQLLHSAFCLTFFSLEERDIMETECDVAVELFKTNLLMDIFPILCKNNSTCFGCLWCLWLSLSCFGSIWLDVKIWKNAEKS